MSETVISKNITLTDKAAEHVKSFLAKNGASIGLRLATKTTGCSGYQYIVEAAEQTTDQDEIFESKGVKIFVDKLSLPMLIGTEMDYVREGLNEEFQFKNPNSQETCGCGESFSV
ncbi:MAG: iron-sulfur cluster assembly accessory protein [Proteobacteria bacterium]|nr:iron-sulfur cluster assembly accessory protein [Pseudomonadota bacterium]